MGCGRLREGRKVEFSTFCDFNYVGLIWDLGGWLNGLCLVYEISNEAGSILRSKMSLEVEFDERQSL